MIQRKQTVYLLFSAIAISLMFIFPFAEGFTNDGYLFVFSLNGIDSINSIPENLKINTIPLIILLVAILILTIVSIFYFKNRLTQIRIVIFCILLIIGLGFIDWFYIKQFSKLITENLTIKFPVILPAISAILSYLAIKAIRKDEKLVRSADRIR